MLVLLYSLLWDKDAVRVCVHVSCLCLSSFLVNSDKLEFQFCLMTNSMYTQCQDICDIVTNKKQLICTITCLRASYSTYVLSLHPFWIHTIDMFFQHLNFVPVWWMYGEGLWNFFATKIELQHVEDILFWGKNKCLKNMGVGRGG